MTNGLAVGLTPLETRRDVVLHLAVRAEQLGYEAFFLAEGWGHDAGVLLAQVAARTTRIRLGTGVLNVWGRSAAGLAMLAATLNEASAGRFTLGLGVGSPELAEGLHDLPYADPVRRLGTAARQTRRLLAGERIAPSVPGARPLRLALPPGPAVPIALAALGPRAIRLTGEVADAWYPFLLPRSALPAGLDLLAEGAAAAGRAPGAVRAWPCLPTAVADDAGAAREVAAWWLAFYLGSMGPLYRATLRRLGFGPAVDAVVEANPGPRSTVLPAAAEGLLDDLLLHGTPCDARKALDGWSAAGADMPVLALPPNRPLDELDFVLTELAATPCPGVPGGDLPPRTRRSAP